ncbi:MAG: hypothetical protein R3E66_10285 [bacterium]
MAKEQFEKALITLTWEDTPSVVGVIAQWFGIPMAFFEDYRILRANPKTLNIVNADTSPEQRPEPQSIGMPFLHTDMAVPKLTQPASLWLGPLCTRNIVNLDRARAAAYLARATVALEPADLVECDGTGYVMVRCEGLSLGLAFRHRNAVMDLVSMVPKAWALNADVDPF